MRYHDIVTVDGEGEYLVTYVGKYDLQVEDSSGSMKVSKRRCEKKDYSQEYNDACASRR